MKNAIVFSLVICILAVFVLSLMGCQTPFVFETYLQKAEWVQPKLFGSFELHHESQKTGTFTWGKWTKSKNATFQTADSELQFIYDPRKYTAKVIDAKTQIEWATIAKLDRTKAEMTLKDHKTFVLELYLSKAALRENTTQVLAMNAPTSRKATLFVLQETGKPEQMQAALFYAFKIGLQLYHEQQALYYSDSGVF